MENEEAGKKCRLNSEIKSKPTINHNSSKPECNSLGCNDVTVKRLKVASIIYVFLYDFST